MSAPSAPYDKPPPYEGPQTGYQATAPAPAGFVPSYQTIVPEVSTRIIIVGGCPACGVGVLEDEFTCLGLLLAILFFPLGILCCYALRVKRCPNCGAIFG